MLRDDYEAMYQLVREVVLAKGFGEARRIAAELLGVPRVDIAQRRADRCSELRGHWTAFGTVDSDYRGEVRVSLFNLDSIAALGMTERGEAGFGSTGR